MTDSEGPPTPAQLDAAAKAAYDEAARAASSAAEVPWEDLPEEFRAEIRSQVLDQLIGPALPAGVRIARVNPDPAGSFNTDDVKPNPRAKVPGVHRWVALCEYTLSDTEAAAWAEGVRVRLATDNMIGFGVGCGDCMEDYDDARGTVCQGEK